jgi:hypothetical protein
VNKEKFQEIVLSEIIEKDRSTGRKGEVKFQKYDDSTDK